MRDVRFFSLHHIRSLMPVYLIINVMKGKERLRTRVNRLKIPENYIHAFRIALRNIVEMIGKQYGVIVKLPV